MKKRVVITGLGAITPIGKTANETWNGIKNKECGVDEIKLFNAENFKTKFEIRRRDIFYLSVHFRAMHHWIFDD